MFDAGDVLPCKQRIWKNDKITKKKLLRDDRFAILRLGILFFQFSELKLCLWIFLTPLLDIPSLLTFTKGRRTWMRASVSMTERVALSAMLHVPARPATHTRTPADTRGRSARRGKGERRNTREGTREHATRHEEHAQFRSARRMPRVQLRVVRSLAPPASGFQREETPSASDGSC